KLLFTIERRLYIISIKKEGIMDTEKAYLSNDKDMIQFRYGDKIIRFRGPYSLERFISVKEWDNGYIVVMAKYQHNAEPEEEYIDMIPVLRDLYIDASVFLKPIKEVRLVYGQD
ncbi:MULTISPECIES: hypothetical protein, partial [unclassified Clostridium]|uniref:DUF7724 family protein n=1 Tax=unclassified Clostridium TaxID=2614128 RepID=UPI001FA9644E